MAKRVFVTVELAIQDDVGAATLNDRIFERLQNLTLSKNGMYVLDLDVRDSDRPLTPEELVDAQ